MLRATAASTTVVPNAGNDAAAASASALARSVNAMRTSSRFPDPPGGGTTVDGDFAAGQITGRVGRQERDQFCDLVGCAASAERSHRVAAGLVTTVTDHGGVDRPGAHRVHPDAVVAEFDRRGARQPPQSPFRRTVRGGPCENL